MQQRSGLRQTPGRGAGAAEGSRSVCRFSRGPPGPTIGAGAPQQPHHGRSSSSGSGSGSRAKQQQQHDGAGTEPPALSVLLPNGRQFQLQMVVARDGQDPTWRFAGLSGASRRRGGGGGSCVCSALLRHTAATEPCALQQPSAGMWYEGSQCRTQALQTNFKPPYALSWRGVCLQVCCRWRPARW
jgi:hypothetical protein